MKATKKIVGAAVALVAAVALSAGSTFAWFSSNGTVTATGLSVDVKTDNSYLVIAANTGTISSSSADTDLTTLSLAGVGKTDDDAATQLLPSAYKTYTMVDGTETLTDPTKEGGSTDENAPSVVTPTTWYTAQGTSESNGALKDGTKKDLTADDFGQYVVSTEFVVSVSTGSIDVEHIYAKMECTLTDSTKTAPINVVFLYQYVAKIESDSGTNFGTVDTSAYKKYDVLATTGLGSLDLCAGLGENGADVTVSAYDHIAIKVMVYMDGNNNAVYTKNQVNLTGVTLNFTFSDKESTTPST